MSRHERRRSNGAAERTANNPTDRREQQARVEDKKLDVTTVLDAVKSKYETVTKTKVFSEETDPNNTLGKTGSYVEGGAFWDTRTKYSNDGEVEEEKARWGTDAGGAIEIFKTTADAADRLNSLKAAQGSILDPGAARRVDNVILRVSYKYPASLQDEILTFLEGQVRQ